MRSSLRSKLLLGPTAAAAALCLSACAVGFGGPATDITETGATLNGLVGSSGQEQGSYFFRYGETSAYGESTPVRSADFASHIAYSVSEPVTGLSGGTTYHYSLCADDPDPGGARCSADQTFATYSFPRGVAFAYVADTGGENVLQFDVGAAGLLTPLIPPTVTFGRTPVSVAVAPDGESVYVGLGDDRISQWDVGPRGALTPKTPNAVALTGSGPGSLAVAPDGSSLYVGDASTDSVSQYGIGAGGLLAAKSPPSVPAGDNPLGVAVSPDGGSVYVTNLVDGTISQYGVSGSGLLSPLTPPTVLAGDDPVGVAVSPDGQSVYVVNSGSDFDMGSVSQYDVAADGTLAPKSPATVAAGSFATYVAIAPDGAHVYVTNRESDSVSLYDVGSGGRLTPHSPGSATAGDAPGGIALTPDGQRAYVVNTTSDDISQYDVAADGTLTPKSPATVAGGVVASAIAVAPAPTP